MKPPNAKPPRAAPPTVPDDASTGLPGFRTWPGVYLFVLGAFLAVVIALTIFSRYFA